jgi:hypothetical protein
MGFWPIYADSHEKDLQKMSEKIQPGMCSEVALGIKAFSVHL